jgi:rRNA maturation RNase YbeY
MQSTEKESITVIRETVGTIPSLPFFDVAQKILGKKYVLRLIFSTKKNIQHLNKTYRKKTYIPNTLAFPLTKNEGEIYMSLSIMRSQAKNYNLSYTNFILFLFIHSCLHLKGYAHGSTMEKQERQYLKQFAPHATYPYDYSDRD